MVNMGGRGEGSKALSPEKEETASNNYDAWADPAFSCGEQAAFSFNILEFGVNIDDVWDGFLFRWIDANIAATFDGTLDQLVYLFSKQSGLKTTAVKFRGDNHLSNEEFVQILREKSTEFLRGSSNSLCREVMLGSLGSSDGSISWKEVSKLRGSYAVAQMRQFLGKRCAKSFNCILPNLLLFMHNTTNSSAMVEAAREKYGREIKVVSNAHKSNNDSSPHQRTWHCQLKRKQDDEWLHTFRSKSFGDTMLSASFEVQ
ncbi:integrase-type DNA-binding superfamily protein, partial [Striga asiatica]